MEANCPLGRQQENVAKCLYKQKSKSEHTGKHQHSSLWRGHCYRDNKGQLVCLLICTVMFNEDHTTRCIQSICSSRLYFISVFFFLNILQGKIQSYGAEDYRKSRAITSVTKSMRIFSQQSIISNTLQMHSKSVACIFVFKIGRRKQRASVCGTGRISAVWTGGPQWLVCSVN